MALEAIIKSTPKKLLVGHCLEVNLGNQQQQKLWSGFMPNKKHIQHTLSKELFSVEVYKDDLTPSQIDFKTTIQKWAAVEVSSFEDLPLGMQMLEIPEGLYAVFIYKGLPADAADFFSEVYHEWFPSSPYTLDHRPHFEVMSTMYQNNHPDSEEEIWVPIKLK